MTGAGPLPAATGIITAALELPLLLLLACVSRPMRSWMPSLLWLAPIPALAAALLADGRDPDVLSVFGATLALDVPGAMLLGVAAVLWIAAGIYAAAYLHEDANAGRFAIWWLLALTGNIGVFMAADAATFYLFFAMGSLSAYGLITHDGTAGTRRAGAVYVAFALLGEACVLMGLVLLAAGAPDNSLLIRDAVAALPSSRWRDPALALLIAGFGLKIGLVPLHTWMPLAYTASPIPAAAVLSGAAVKAGVIGFIRFMPFGDAMPGWGEALAAVGLFSAFYGVAVGVTQSNPKTVLAYSSVSQMGLIATVVGMGLANGDGGTALAAGFIAAHHVLVKGALFLAIGVAAATGANRLWLVGVPAAVIALSLAGLPLTGGALAKAVSKAPLGDGVAGGLAALAAAGTALLMLHFLKCLAATPRPNSPAPPPPGLTLPWLVMAPAAVAIPWALFPSAIPGGFANVVFIAGLLAALWPIVIGALLAFWLWRSPYRLPDVPEGDFGGFVLERGLRAAIVCGAAFERADMTLRQWPVAGVSLLALTVAFGAALAIVH